MASKIEGHVVEIGSSGVLITGVTSAALREVPRDDQTIVCCNEHETPGIYDGTEGHPESTFIAYLGQQGTLELTIVGMNASELLGIKVGMPVSIRW
ncbi:MAG: SAM hydroxide adenosyltransferase [Pirellulaceae bacterium]